MTSGTDAAANSPREQRTDPAPAPSPDSGMRDRRSSLISETERRQARDDRTVADLRQDICRRLEGDGQYLPRVLSRATVVAILDRLDDDTRQLERVAADLNHIKLRRWLADLVGFYYEPTGGRGYTLRKDELQQVDYALADAGYAASADIDTSPPVVR